MKNGFVEVVAYQETLLIIAVFGLAILAMIWIGFRRWLQYKERMDRLLIQQAVEEDGHLSVYMQRVEARLNTIEQIMTDDRVQSLGQIERDTIPQAVARSEPDSTRAKS